ncbi:MAG: IS630 family transposase [Spirochaetaceae bacterium]|jgi:transposase|nr:IS630 family transposase [Spirochaetaceae bacterium]
MKEIMPNVNSEDTLLMEKLLRAGHIAHKYARRLQIVLQRSRGKSAQEIADNYAVGRSTVSTIINRYNKGGLESLLHDKTRKPGRAPISVETKNKICETACHKKPKNATHWSTRDLAKKFRVSKATVNRILRERDIKPHKVATFTLSTDEQFAEKLNDVAGLYLNPPDNAIVLCLDEKSEIQALERSAPLLPLGPHIPARQTVDYFRHGTTTLFAALDMLTGNVKGMMNKTHNSKDFISFLKKLDRECCAGKVLHIILDNYSAHKSKVTNAYLSQEKIKDRFVLHFIPTHSSWLNMVERWFAEITNKRIRRESWQSVGQLVKAIRDYIKAWNKSERKFVWTKNRRKSSPPSIKPASRCRILFETEH